MRSGGRPSSCTSGHFAPASHLPARNILQTATFGGKKEFFTTVKRALLYCQKRPTKNIGQTAMETQANFSCAAAQMAQVHFFFPPWPTKVYFSHMLVYLHAIENTFYREHILYICTSPMTHKGLFLLSLQRFVLIFTFLKNKNKPLLGHGDTGNSRVCSGPNGWSTSSSASSRLFLIINKKIKNYKQFRVFPTFLKW